MMKNILFIIILIHIPGYSQKVSGDKDIFYDFCPFECCQFGEWVIEDNIDVYADEGDRGTAIFSLHNNDTIYAETGNLHFTRIGKVLVTDSVYDYKPGDTLLVYNCNEGEFLVKHRGEERYIDTFWPEFFYKEDDTEENYIKKIKEGKYSGKMIQRPETIWWVKIRSKEGEGWIRLENKTPYCFSIEEKISGMDGCG